MNLNLLPGNIKQKLVPFQIHPVPSEGMTVNSAEGNNELAFALPQVFTYKNIESPRYKDKRFLCANISFLPKAFDDVVRKDIGYRLLYNDSNVTSDKPTADEILANTIFDNIPGIQIREYLPDTKLDQLISAIGSLLDEIGKMFKDKTIEKVGQEFAGSLQKVATLFATMNAADFKLFAKLLVDYLLGVSSDESTVGQGPLSTFMNDLFTNDKTAAKFNGIYSKPLFDAMALKIPYMLYYGLLSTTTTNIYEVPFVNEPKLLYTSSGSAGWGDSAGFISHIIDTAKSILGAVIPNVGISMTPWWNTSTGQGTFEDEVVVNFDLYNDSKERAEMNFIFVNTIIPNNKWILYGLLLHSPCLYDIKVEGIKRMYACTGDFKVTYSGVLRRMPKTFIDNLVNVHANTAISKEKLKKHSENIRIPDVYHVSLTFKSLLPSNMNLYLFLYIGNSSIILQVGNDYARPSNILSNIAQGISNVKNSLGVIIDESTGLKVIAEDADDPSYNWSAKNPNAV